LSSYLICISFPITWSLLLLLLIRAIRFSASPADLFGHLHCLSVLPSPTSFALSCSIIRSLLHPAPDLLSHSILYIHSSQILCFPSSTCLVICIACPWFLVHGS
jgi:hypothetical protein